MFIVYCLNKNYRPVVFSPSQTLLCSLPKQLLRKNDVLNESRAQTFFHNGEPDSEHAIIVKSDNSDQFPSVGDPKLEYSVK